MEVILLKKITINKVDITKGQKIEVTNELAADLLKKGAAKAVAKVGANVSKSEEKE